MTPSKGIVEIRTLAELLSLYEIASDSTLTKDQYRNPLRPYRLIQPEASCQYQKNGKRCSQMHQHGFVVERHDDSKVLIGNCCALNHLGLDDEQVRGELKNPFSDGRPSDANGQPGKSGFVSITSATWCSHRKPDPIWRSRNQITEISL